jgi:POT family proton-dependent oligopeptide transporter
MLKGLCPTIVFVCKPRYTLYPPEGSVVAKAWKLWMFALKQKWSWNPITFRRNVKAPGFWDAAMPSQLGVNKPAWMTFDDAWVEEVRRGLMACKVFLWYPLYWLSYGQMTNNLTSQAATMDLGAVPNDIVSNLNPLFIVILIPLMDRVVYPGLRRLGVKYTPIKRIATGFFLASMAMVSATVTQSYIYKMHPCRTSANSCEDDEAYAPISVWVQIVPYALIGFSEIMASVTSLEYAFTKAPTNMRSFVQAVALFMNAISSALAQALVALAEDPLLTWNYGVVAVLAAAGGILFWLDNFKLDREEDALNQLNKGKFTQQGHDVTPLDKRVSDVERGPTPVLGEEKI